MATGCARHGQHRQGATEATKAANQKVLDTLSFNDRADFEDAKRGLLSCPFGKVKIIAPQAFVEDAVSENVIAGNAMGWRAVYLYGALLPRNPKGGVNGGLG